MSRTHLGLIGGLLLLVVVAWVGGDHGSTLWPFAGRFHPLLVHLPIGILLLALFLDVVGRMPTRTGLRSIVPVALLLGFWVAIVAAVAGLLLADWGSYNPAILVWHRRLGIAIPFLAAAAYWIRARADGTREVVDEPLGRVRVSQQGDSRGYLLVAAALAFTVTIGGHLGGTLSRGEGYLTRHLPDGVRSLVGLPAESARARLAIGNPDSTLVYAGLIQPVLNARCGVCHNADRKKGGLDLTSAKGLMAGGRQGKVVVPGRADESEAIIRLSLPPGHTDAMPPDRPIPIAELELMRWWIDAGASTEVRLSEIVRPASVRRTLAAYGLDDLPTGIFALSMAPPDSRAVAAARATGLEVQPLGVHSGYLSVDATNLSADWDVRQLEQLRPLTANIARVNVAHLPITDPQLALFGAMPRLTHLRLSQTRVTDAGLRALNGAQYLEYLNLVDTDVSDAGLRALEGMSRLRAIYLWGTRTTDGGVARLQRALPRANIVRGATPLRDSSTGPPSARVTTNTR